MAVIQETTYRVGKHEITRQKKLEVGASKPLGKEKILDTGKLLGVQTENNVDIYDKNSLFKPSSGSKNWTEWLQRLQKEEINEAGLKKSYLGGAVEKSYHWEASEAEESVKEVKLHRGHGAPTEEWDGVITPPPHKPVREFVRGLKWDAQVHLIFLRRKAFSYLPESIRPKYMSGESISRTMIAGSMPEANDDQIRRAGAAIAEPMNRGEKFTIKGAEEVGKKLDEIFKSPKDNPTEK
jgi:hypothetical protein